MKVTEDTVLLKKKAEACENNIVNCFVENSYIW